MRSEPTTNKQGQFERLVLPPSRRRLQPRAAGSRGNDHDAEDIAQEASVRAVPLRGVAVATATGAPLAADDCAEHGVFVVEEEPARNQLVSIDDCELAGN